MESAKMPIPPSSDLSCIRPCSPGTLKKSASDHSLYGTDVVIEDQRQLIRGLGEHVIHGECKITGPEFRTNVKKCQNTGFS